MRQEAQDLLKDLGIREEAINTELAESSSRAYAAAQAAVDKKKVLGEFLEGAYSAYMGHVRRYARYYLKACDEKETIATIDDTVVMLFSKSVTDDQRKDAAIKLADFQIASSVGRKDFTSWIKDHQKEYEEQVIKIYQDCFKYQLSGQYYEDYASQKRNLESDSSESEALVEAYRQRAHCLVAIAANLRAAGDLDAYSLKKFSPSMVSDIKKWVLKNPEISPETLSQMAEDTFRERRKENG